LLVLNPCPHHAAVAEREEPPATFGTGLRQIDLHAHRPILNIGKYAHLLYRHLFRLGVNLHPADDAVPVALRLVAHAVGVLPHAHAVDAVADGDGYLIARSRSNRHRDVVFMGRGKTVARANAYAVDAHLSGDVRTLQKEHHAPTSPLLRQIDRPRIAGFADEVAFRSKEKRSLQTALLPIFRHIGIVIERRVVDGTRPLRLLRRQFALAVLKQRARQHHIAGRVEHPLARQTDHILLAISNRRQPPRRQHHAQTPDIFHFQFSIFNSQRYE